MAGASRRAVLGLAAAPLLAAVAGGARAQAPWPSKLIKLVVPFPAGDPTDTASRIVGQQLGERLKQSVIVDNRAGASGAIAAAQVAKAAPDGYTLMTLATPTLLAPYLYKKTGYDPTKDFAPVAMFYDLPIVIVVNPKALPGVTDLSTLIQHAKAQKVPMNYTSAGTGSFGHLSMELLKQMGGFDMQHVPYKGSAPAIADTIGGQVPVMFSDLIAALPHVKAAWACCPRSRPSPSRASRGTRPSPGAPSSRRPARTRPLPSAWPARSGRCSPTRPCRTGCWAPAPSPTSRGRTRRPGASSRTTPAGAS
jgi:tripartite-type tricarboxylate transporter receptor subunit TctC